MRPEESAALAVMMCVPLLNVLKKIPPVPSAPVAIFRMPLFRMVPPE